MNFLIITSIVFCLISIFSSIMLIRYILKYRKLEKQILPTKENHILRQILEISFEKGRLNKTSPKLIEILKRNYSIDYCTILIKNSRGYYIVSSNIDPIYHDELEEHINHTYLELKAGAKIAYSEHILSYPTARDRSIKYCYFIPLRIDNEIIGGLLIENISTNSPINSKIIETEFWNIVIKDIAIALRNLIYSDKILTVATVDPLTNVYNRRYMEEDIGNKIVRHKERSSVFSIAMMDIDHFKKFNDTYGHQFGDLVLQKVSQYIKDNLRELDCIYRYGGEEFCICFNNASNDVIYPRLEDIRTGISNMMVENENKIQASVTASFGLSEYPSNGLDLKTLIDKADGALYCAKECGRNRTIIYNKNIQEITQLVSIKTSNKNT